MHPSIVFCALCVLVCISNIDAADDPRSNNLINQYRETYQKPQPQYLPNQPLTTQPLSPSSGIQDQPLPPYQEIGKTPLYVSNLQSPSNKPIANQSSSPANSVQTLAVLVEGQVKDVLAKLSPKEGQSPSQDKGDCPIPPPPPPPPPEPKQEEKPAPKPEVDPDGVFVVTNGTKRPWPLPPPIKLVEENKSGGGWFL